MNGDDLLSEILIRLPVKPLLRFKSVSKRWLSLISNPQFCYRHARRNPYAVTGLLLQGYPGLKYSSDIGFVSLNRNPSPAPLRPLHPFSFSFSRGPREGIWWIVQSCNGLLLCFNINSQITHFVVNPSTKQYSMIPPLIDLDIDRGRSMVHCFSLAFDPLKSPFYKVICVRSIGRESYGSLVLRQIEIYSNENGIWRNSGDPFMVPNGMVFNDGVFSNGAIHWISPDCHWMYFNVEEERRGEIRSIEPWSSNDSWFRYFRVSFGYLHLLEICGSQGSRVRVLELEKDYSNWFLKFNVDLNPIVNAYPNMMRSCIDPILSILRGEDDDESSLLLHIPGKIISFKFKDKSFRKLHDLPPCSCNNGGERERGRQRKVCFDAYQYIETLACVRLRT